ncbi:MAG TPA: DUF1643 domain-containing protein [Kamptonema sp.]|nr:DUF1643 domain-containing protein [Kamptonema sp.]
MIKSGSSACSSRFSKSDATTDDPTIRRCISFAQFWGYGSSEVVNLFAYRASRPTILYQIPDPVGLRSYLFPCYVSRSQEKLPTDVSNETNFTLVCTNFNRASRAWQKRGNLFHPLSD